MIKDCIDQAIDDEKFEARLKANLHLDAATRAKRLLSLAHDEGELLRQVERNRLRVSHFPQFSEGDVPVAPPASPAPRGLGFYQQ